MADNSKVITGLPNLPPDTLPKDLWAEFLTIYRAITNTLSGISEFTGIDGPDPLELATMNPSKYLLGANSQQYYPTNVSGGTITRGQVVHLSGSDSVILANAGAASGNALGVADETKPNGSRIKILTSGAVTTAIGGMVPGQYYLSPTVGAIQNLRPVVPGQIVQGIGWALESGVLLIGINPTYIQL